MIRCRIGLSCDRITPPDMATIPPHPVEKAKKGEGKAKGGSPPEFRAYYDVFKRRPVPDVVDHTPKPGVPSLADFFTHHYNGGIGWDKDIDQDQDS